MTPSGRCAGLRAGQVQPDRPCRRRRAWPGRAVRAVYGAVWSVAWRAVGRHVGPGTGVSGGKRFGGSGFTGLELEIGRAVERLSEEWGLQPYQVSLAWLLDRPAVASVIVGAEAAAEVTANATAAAVTLDPAQMDA